MKTCKWCGSETERMWKSPGIAYRIPSEQKPFCEASCFVSYMYGGESLAEGEGFEIENLFEVQR